MSMCIEGTQSHEVQRYGCLGTLLIVSAILKSVGMPTIMTSVGALNLKIIRILMLIST